MVISELLQVTGRLTSDLPWLTSAKFFDRVDSTQNRILQFLPKDAAGPVVVVAEAQSKGVGRQGRPWVSPPGGLWCTLAIPMGGVTPAAAAAFSLVCASALAESLREVNNLETNIKWPNDILHNGKKVAGILLGTVTKHRQGWILVGLGVNVNNDLPAELLKTATSIKIIRNQSQGRSRLLEAVLSAVWTAWGDYGRTGFGPYQKAVDARLHGKGKPAQIKVGRRTISGTLLGVDPQGNLLLKSGSETTTVSAGEIIGNPA